VTRGHLIAFEGLDGSGKSTQLARLAARLRAEGHVVLETREYTDGPWGRKIRTMARSGDTVAPAEELRWFVEDRRQHVAEVIEPALERGEIVLTDRYFVSSAAYQGARGLDPQKILADNEAEFPLPDLCLLFEVDAAMGMERVGARGAEAQPAFEKREFLERVAEVFGAIERPYFVRVDGRGTPEEVEERVAAAVAAWSR
jgi:dTMP kinase